MMDEILVIPIEWTASGLRLRPATRIDPSDEGRFLAESRLALGAVDDLVAQAAGRVIQLDVDAEESDLPMLAAALPDLVQRLLQKGARRVVCDLPGIAGPTAADRIHPLDGVEAVVQGIAERIDRCTSQEQANRLGTEIAAAAAFLGPEQLAGYVARCLRTSPDLRGELLAFLARFRASELASRRSRDRKDPPEGSPS